jgi:hypothetical protein
VYSAKKSGAWRLPTGIIMDTSLAATLADTSMADWLSR